MKLLNPLEHRFLLQGFRRLLPVDAGLEPHLRGVLRDVLAHPGSLVRAQLVYGILHRRGLDASLARSAAIAIEYFHTASLIFDDMPMMDDSRQRRGHVCPHVAYGDAAATLGALALVNQGYALLWRVIGTLDGDAGREAADLVGSCLGAGGILNGQSLDLHFEDGSEDGGERGDAVLAVAEGKTVTLIRLTLLLPAIVAGVGEVAKARLDRLASAWGLAYQVLDDFKDCLMSRTETGKSNRRDERLGRPNLPAAAGPERAMDRLSALLRESRELLRELAAGGEDFPQLERVQHVLEEERRKVLARLPVAACA